jgi:hypothetical protein
MMLRYPEGDLALMACIAYFEINNNGISNLLTRLRQLSVLVTWLCYL